MTNEDLSAYDDMKSPATVDTCPHQAHRIEHIGAREHRMCCTCGAMFHKASWWPVIEMPAIPDELVCDALRDECGGRFMLRVRGWLYEVE